MELESLRQIMEAFAGSEYRELKLVSDLVSLELHRTDGTDPVTGSGTGLTGSDGAGSGREPGTTNPAGTKSGGAGTGNPAGAKSGGAGTGNPVGVKSGGTGTGNPTGVKSGGTDAADTGADGAAQADAAAAGPERTGTIVRAPMAGIFYVAPSPGEKPYVQAGSAVKKGAVLGLLEAMKVISEITAPADGTVTEILLEDAAFAEFDAPLFVLTEERAGGTADPV